MIYVGKWIQTGQAGFVCSNQAYVFMRIRPIIMMYCVTQPTQGKEQRFLMLLS